MTTTPCTDASPPRRRSLLHTACGLSTLVLGMLFVASSCAPSGDPQSSSQTNWFRRCNSGKECGSLECICGACTSTCSSSADCADDSLCLAVTDERAGEFCAGEALATSTCVRVCDASACPEGTTCKAGVCQVLPVPDSVVTVDLGRRYQTLVGFGASLAYAENSIIEQNDRDALYDALFSELGVDTIRVTNRFEPERNVDLQTSADILQAATIRLGRTPTLLMTSGSPPAALKANGSKLCDGEAESCTLVQLDDGSFDYSGFAQFWRESLEAYAAVGVTPDYVSIQNNPNWTPPEGSAADACRFLPEEGTMQVGDVSVRFPGYVAAARAVLAEFGELSNAPALFGPETTTLDAVPRYEPVFAADLLSAIAVHLYEASIEDPRLDELNAVRALSTYYGIPVIQSEMMAEGLETAALIHHATVEANATAYLQNDFISAANALKPNQNALVQLEDSGFTRQSPFFALQHYAARTEPGWVRVHSQAVGGELLVSAWIAPKEDALTLVILNTGTDSFRTQLDLGDVRDSLGRSQVTQTVFNAALEHSALGPLRDDGWLDVPGQAAITVAFED